MLPPPRLLSLSKGVEKKFTRSSMKNTRIFAGYGRTAPYGQWSPGSLIVARKRPDYAAALSYVGATATQFTLLLTFLHIFQIGLLKNLFVPSFFARVLPDVLANYMPSPAQLQKMVVFATMLFMSVRSRVFSPLDNARPRASKSDKAFNRIKPWWQPPPLAFPVIWSSIAFLRAISTTMVFQASGTMLTKPIFAMFLHLSCGDTWNTINNVEGRLGTAALTVPFVLATAAYTTACYYVVSKSAAKVLFPSVIWLTVATALVYSIYKLNNRGNRYSMFPSKEEGPPSKWMLPFTR
jgi:tryptophan-rich sensory protein